MPTNEERAKLLEQIKRLPHEKRLEALRKLEEELEKQEQALRKESEEQKNAVIAAKELTVSSEKEIAKLEELLPAQKEFKVEELFKPDEELEKRVASERARTATEEQQRQYNRDLAGQPTGSLYQEAKRLSERLESASSQYDAQRMSDDLRKNYEERLMGIGKEVEYRESMAARGDYHASKDTIGQWGAIEKMVSQHYS